MDKEKCIEWFEFDYMPRVGAYRKDCKTGCDGCMTKHDGDNYCDIDMLSKVLSLLKEQEKRINEFEEKLRLLEYGDLHALQSAMMPAT